MKAKESIRTPRGTVVYQIKTENLESWHKREVDLTVA